MTRFEKELQGDSAIVSELDCTKSDGQRFVLYKRKDGTYYLVTYDDHGMPVDYMGEMVLDWITKSYNKSK